MRQSDTIEALAKALVAAQGELEPVPKTAVNPHFRSRFAPLDAIVKATQPVLAKHGLSVLQGGAVQSDTQPEYVTITTRIMHESGEWIESDLTMRPSKNDPQGVGSCLTYASRYGYRMVGVVTDEDDDGNSVSNDATSAGTPADNNGEVSDDLGF